MLLAIYLTPVARRPLGLGDSGPCWISNQAKALGRSAAAAVAAARSVMLAAMSTGVAAQRAPQRPSGKEQTLSRAASHYASTTEGESRAEATVQMSRRRAVCDCRVKADCAALRWLRTAGPALVVCRITCGWSRRCSVVIPVASLRRNSTWANNFQEGVPLPSHLFIVKTDSTSPQRAQCTYTRAACRFHRPVC